MFEPQILVALGALFMLSAFVQGVIGFGFALLALPVMLGLGLSLPQAVLTVTIGASVQMGWAAFAMRDSIPWRRLAPVCIVAMLTTPIGIWLLQFVSTQGTSIVRQVIGGIILLVVTAWWTIRPKPRAKLGWGWDLLAGVISGVLGGLASVAGTSLIVWTHAHKWTNQEYRVAPVATMFPRSLLQIGLMLAMMPGEALGPAIPSALLLVPGTILGAILGVHFGHRLSVPLLRVLVSLALVIMGLSSLLGPLL
ncbi:MAG: sulfite exporter TauE/SafE family protein [Verrucomicrobia bacterium]|nr:sulfite exporter TauE/SafE family protein [Verrucomicrobiota bacterium]MDA1086827.1 sulfite exporter TauE/SafE family protein [Verrucomicrobiota bacterium]